MSKILLVTPPFIQVNAPYPATAYLKGYLTRHGVEAEQFDLSIELICKLFSRDTIEEIFATPPSQPNESINRIYVLRHNYIETIDFVIKFLQTNDPAMANLICMPEFIPQASRFESITDLDSAFGQLGTVDCAKYISTLYLQDTSDYIRATVSDNFEIVKYAEHIAVSTPTFDKLKVELSKPVNLIERKMIGLLEEKVKATSPEYIGFSVPFPGNLLAALRCAQHIKQNHPSIKTLMGGGYPSTELRQLTDKEIFNYFDFVSLDDGERPLEMLLTQGKAENMLTADGYHEKITDVSHSERGCPDFSGLPHNKYLSLCEVINPMHRLWSDGRWNKMMTTHGCYWAKCSFCDTSLDYIKCYDSVPASRFVDWMCEVQAQTGSSGFHFTDEAATPKMLRDISLEIIKRGLKFTWWTNIRFEKSFTGDLCQLMAAAGCIAVSGGLEVASDRLLAKINKGITIEQATIVMRNFFYSGIMVHTYLMYGLPTQTLQETIDSLEVVRQLFRAQLINSAFWHRYAMTLHSPSGQNPEEYGVKLKKQGLNPFANNEIYFAEDRGYNINTTGESLRTALSNYMVGSAIDKPAHKWFEGKAQPTTVENSLVTDHLIKPDSSRLFSDEARIVWIGNEITSTEEGILLNNSSSQKSIKLKDEDRDFIMEAVKICGDLDKKTTLADLKQLYKTYGKEPLSFFYHSKKWDMLRAYGLLQI